MYTAGIKRERGWVGERRARIYSSSSSSTASAASSSSSLSTFLAFFVAFFFAGLAAAAASGFSACAHAHGGVRVSKGGREGEKRGDERRRLPSPSRSATCRPRLSPRRAVPDASESESVDAFC